MDKASNQEDGGDRLCGALPICPWAPRPPCSVMADTLCLRIGCSWWENGVLRPRFWGYLWLQVVVWKDLSRVQTCLCLWMSPLPASVTPRLGSCPRCLCAPQILDELQCFLRWRPPQTVGFRLCGKLAGGCLLGRELGNQPQARAEMAGEVPRA